MILPASAWFGWADQAAYFLSARGWATGDFDAAHHLYPAGYALLAAPFFRLMPDDPFYVPNVACWIASLWLFASLAARLGFGVVRNRAAGGLIFCVVTVVSSRAFYTWEIPWTSTPATVLVFGATLAVLRHAERPAALTAALAAALASLVALVRPTDALIVMTGIGLVIMLTALRPFRFRVLVAAGAGFCTGPVLLVATHVATHGWVLGYYFENSRLIGFEWRLLPLRWVTLVLSPQPLFDSGDGLEAFFPTLLPGLAGVLACWLGAGRRLPHALAGGMAVAVLCLYLCYRDLHVQGVNQFMNYHYFKWALPLFGLYAANLLVLVARRRWAVLPALAVVVLLSLWRADLVSDSKAQPARVVADGHSLTVPGGLPDMDQAVLVRAPADFLTIYFGAHEIRRDGRRLINNADFKLYPVPSGVMLTPLRRLPGPLTVNLAEPLRLDPAATPFMARQRLKFGLPCIILPTRASCRYVSVLQPSP